MRDEPTITVSVIVPIFNAEPYLQQCLESLRLQTLPAMEFILINDASIDNSGALCDQYAAMDNRFRVFHNQTNQQQAYCLNKGIELAKGEYIGTVDADDWVDIGFFDKLYWVACNTGADISKGSLIKWFPTGKKVVQKGLNRRINQGIRHRKPLVKLFNHEITTAIYRRALIIQHGITFPQIPNGLDIVFLLKVCSHANSIVTVNNCYYYYRIHTQSVSRTYGSGYYQSILGCFREHLRFANGNKVSDQLYYYLFCKGLMGCTRRYNTFVKDTEGQILKKDYTQQILEIVKEYQGDRQLLLNYLFFGMIRQQQLARIRKTWPFRFFYWVRHCIKSVR